jgi:exodeoxyribonuclease V alpha subunit
MVFTVKSIKNTSTINNSIIKLNCIVNNFRYKDEESNFFVLTGELLKSEQDLSKLIVSGLKLENKFAVVGNSSIVTNQIIENQELEITGTLEIGKDNKLQIKAETIQEVIPSKPKAIEYFLASGKLYGIGKATAHLMVKEYGSRIIDVLDNQPEKLLGIKGITEKKLELIKKCWKEWRELYEIIGEMAKYGHGDTIAKSIYEYFGTESINIIQNDTYRLTEVDGIGFARADTIAQKNGMDLNNVTRIKQGILYILEEVSQKGHTAYQTNSLIAEVNKILQINENLIKEQIDVMIKEESIIPTEIKVTKLNYLNKKYETITTEGLSHAKYYYTELSIARNLKRITDSKNQNSTLAKQEKINKFLKDNPYGLDSSQLEAAKNILSNKVSILTGGPGTGKTHTIKSLIKYFQSDKKIHYISGFEEELDYSIVLSAPTGKAAKRINESTGMDSSTIHRLLEFKDGGFEKNSLNKLDGDVYVLDESSMIDIFLMNSFLQALPSDAILIIVGDTDQLASVAAGAVLKDMINSRKIIVSALKEPHRQALDSDIIKSAYEVVHGIVPKLNSPESSSDFVLYPMKEDQNIHDTILEVIANLISKGENANNIQILTPKKESILGTIHLNNTMRPILNPRILSNTEELKYVIGDRLMQFKNNKELDIYNGDTGYVIDVNPDESSITVNFDNRLINFELNQQKTLNLSYAITIHKSQGSDFPYVIIPVTSSHQFMWDMNLFYTAITRAKNKVILVGEEKVVKAAIANVKQNTRITLLEKHIKDTFELENENNKNVSLNDVLEPIKKYKI